ncbi:MAG: hypothetical protein M1833_007281 [Piccolia ochrophora]|nr:MAG: hypothetical protein M1833_007281 [Piccolia ochrophora]
MSLTETPTNQSQKSATTKLHTSRTISGHVGHLTGQQEELLAKFKDLAAKNGLYTPPEGGQPASHDDHTLVRFLRARKFDVNAAFAQYKDTEGWRQTNQIDALYEHFDVESYEKARVMYPQWTGHRDRRGIPVYVYEIKHLNAKNMTAYTKNASSNVTATTHKTSTTPAKLLRLFALYENMLQFVLPLCSTLPRSNPEMPVSSTCNVVDISGVGLKQFWNLKGHMQDASVLATAHYPETLDRIFIIGAPGFFPTVWNWIKRWFDPVTVAKIVIVPSTDVKSTLVSYIESSSLPKKYGGELDWEFGKLPDLDAQAKEAIRPSKHGEEWVRGPVLWRAGQRVVVGSVDGKDRREEPVVGKPAMNGAAVDPAKPSTGSGIPGAASAQPAPAEPAPAEPAPAQPAPAEPAPAEPAPAEPAPAEPAPAEPAPAEPAPAEPASAEPTPVDTASSEPITTQAPPTEAPPTEAPPTEALLTEAPTTAAPPAASPPTDPHQPTTRKKVFESINSQR